MALSEARKARIKSGYETVIEGIEAARKRGAGQAVTLVAATKGRSAEEINYAAALGLTDIGENRVQELCDKFDALDKKLNIHFIGALQTNKVKYLVGKVALIHSVDRLSLAQEIDRRSARLGLTTDVLVEVNLGESQKSGVSPENLEELLRGMAKLPHIRVCGLMAVPPISHSIAEQIAISEKFIKIYIDNRDKNIDNIDMHIISFGMSEDYPVAVETGANLVRVGSAIFGARDVPAQSATKHGGRLK